MLILPLNGVMLFLFLWLSMKQFFAIDVQGDQLDIAVFCWYLVKVIFTMYTCTLAYTGQVTFYKVPEKHGHV